MNSDDIKKLAYLARIEIDETSIEGLSNDFNSILEYVDTIQEVNTSQIPYEHTKNVLREDVSPHEPGEYTEGILSQAPKTQDGFIKVPKIL